MLPLRVAGGRWEVGDFGRWVLHDWDAVDAVDAIDAIDAIDGTGMD
jgi:hypothetical protein